MKRRTFISSLAGLGAAAALAITYKQELVEQSAEYIAKKKARATFRLFFKVATTFEPNDQQMIWFDQYVDGQTISFKGARQTGMTTFMTVLALYESKVHGKSVIITPQSSGMVRRVVDIIDMMSLRLGKSVNDGDVVVGVCMYYNPRSFNLQFNMADGGMYMETVPITCGNKYSENVYYFGTNGFYVLLPKVNAPWPKINIA